MNSTLNYKDDRCTAVLGAYKNLELTIKFLDNFHKQFPDIPVSVGMLGNPKDYQEKLLKLYEGQDWIRFAAGKADQRVSFSENWNAAIRGIGTERFVFLHNDMYIHQDFFKILNTKMDEYGSEFFYLYTTVEPLENQGFVRPGKIVAPFGYSFEDFDEEKFYRFARKYIPSHIKDDVKGYGFYLAGFTKSLFDVGGFDSVHFNPYFCEDDDINVRIRLKGYKILVVPALVYHFGSKTIRLETKESMSGVEIESNRNFARKWGIEARYLWRTGYENVSSVSLGSERIAFESPAHQGIGPNLDPIDILNIEPVVDMLLLSPEEIESTKEYFKRFKDGKAFNQECPEFDISIQQILSTFSFDEFANLIGNLRFYHKYLKPGESLIGNFHVSVLRTGDDRVDSVNYLSESVK